MKQLFSFLFFVTFLSCQLNAQLTKRNWLVGGDAYFSSLNSKGPNITTYSRINIVIAPDIGYFIIDKLVSGLKIFYEYAKFTSQGSDVNSYYGIGPFVRYYVLSADQRINFLTQAEYSFKFNEYHGSISKNYTYGFSAGPVIYFNTSVGLELTVKYLKNKFRYIDDYTTQILVGFGLQIHLEKDH